MRTCLTASRLVALVLVSLLGLFASTVGCSSTDYEACIADEQCPSSLVCLGGECVLRVPADTKDAGREGDDAAPPSCVTGDCEGRGVCEVASGRCVACTGDDECGLHGACDRATGVCACGAGYHRCGTDCVADDDPQRCGPGCEVCPEVPDGSAICRAGVCGIVCEGGVDPNDGACTGCTSNQACSDPGASACREERCVPCEGDDDCTHLPGNGLCSAGRCVTCTVGDESACEGTSCDPATNTCTETMKESRPPCASCRADSECEPDHHCVPMQFQGEALDAAYCLRLSAPDGCARPYPAVVSRTSLSGLTETFCAPKESLTTCKAVRDYNAFCTDHSDCGIDGLDDARCEWIDFERVACTFPCDAGLQCPESSVTKCALGESEGQWCGAY